MFWRFFVWGNPASTIGKRAPSIRAVCTSIQIQTLSIRPLFKTSRPYLSCLSSLGERGPHLGRSDLAGQLYSTRATFQIIKVPRDLPTAIKAWIMEVGSLLRQDEEKFFFLFLWIPRQGFRCDDDQAQSCIVCNPLIRSEGNVFGASVGLRKWFCKKIPRWVVSLKETDKFNFSIFPPDRWSWRGVDKKVNIPSADVPSICIITLEKIPFVYWNGHSTSQTVHHRPVYCASYIFRTVLKLQKNHTTFFGSWLGTICFQCFVSELFLLCFILCEAISLCVLCLRAHIRRPILAGRP